MIFIHCGFNITDELQVTVQPPSTHSEMISPYEACSNEMHLVIFLSEGVEAVKNRPHGQPGGYPNDTPVKASPLQRL